MEKFLGNGVVALDMAVDMERRPSRGVWGARLLGWKISHGDGLELLAAGPRAGATQMPHGCRARRRSPRGVTVG